MKSSDITNSEVAGTLGGTQWSVVLKAARQSKDATQAFDRLARVYWTPLYEFVLRRGYQPADAKDIVQAFFQFLMEKKPLETVDPAKGRFRSFLLVILRHFISNKQTMQKAQKRGGGRAHIPLDGKSPDNCGRLELSIDCSPDEAFDADWARTLVGQALEQLKAEYETAGRINIFNNLNPYLSPHGDHSAYDRVARELGMSEDAVRMAVNRLRRRFRTVLRAWIAETVSTKEDVTEEYQYLVQVLASTGKSARE